MLIIFALFWLIYAVDEVRNQAGPTGHPKISPQTARPVTQTKQVADPETTPAIKVTIAAKTSKLVTKDRKGIITSSTDSHASSDWLIFGYNGYTVIIGAAALIIVLLICIIIALLLRRNANAAAAPKADADQAQDGVEYDGGGGPGYPPPPGAAKGWPFRFFRSRVGFKMQRGYPQRPPINYAPQAPYPGGGTGESQMGAAGGEEFAEPYDQEGTGESAYGGGGQDDGGAYQEQYPSPPQGYGRGFKTRSPFRGGRPPSPKYPGSPPMQFQVKRKKTLKRGSGPGKFLRPSVKRGYGGRGYGAPGQY